MGDMADWANDQYDPDEDHVRWDERRAEGSEMNPYDYERVLLVRERSWYIRMPGATKNSMPRDLWFPKCWDTGKCVLEEDVKRIWVPAWLAVEKGLE